MQVIETLEKLWSSVVPRSLTQHLAAEKPEVVASLDR